MAAGQANQPQVRTISTESRQEVLGDDTLLTINEVATLVGVTGRGRLTR